MMNTTPNGPETEASTRKTPGTWMFTSEINSDQEIDIFAAQDMMIFQCRFGNLNGL
jgi:hypothetical protein